MVVILSEVVVCEADDNAVEGPHVTKPGSPDSGSSSCPLRARRERLSVVVLAPAGRGSFNYRTAYSRGPITAAVH